MKAHENIKIRLENTFHRREGVEQCIVLPLAFLCVRKMGRSQEELETPLWQFIWYMHNVITHFYEGMDSWFITVSQKQQHMHFEGDNGNSHSQNLEWLFLPFPFMNVSTQNEQLISIGLRF